MRYAIVSKGLSVDQLEAEALKIGAKDVNRTCCLTQVFCELDEGQAKRLSQVPGLRVKPVQEFRTEQMLMQTTALPSAETPSDVFYLLRSYFSPPLSGAGLTVAVLDTGIRSSHEALRSKVVYEKNFTDSPGTGDVFGHGTNVAHVIAGGMHAAGEDAGVSPGAALMNIKTINDEGLGTDESLVRGIDEVCDLVAKARRQGLWPTEDLFPNVINMSLGAPDDGDPDNPVRIACREASLDYGLDVIAAAGNYGPKMTTVLLPACDPEVIAVGAIGTLDFAVWEKSSRGPTVEGETKPDFVFWGTDIRMASHKGDDAYDVKSGTSFATPMLSGLTGLLWETGRRSYGELWEFRWTAVREFAPYISVKPEDAPLKKDNAYGYGLPAMSAMLGEIGGTSQPAADATQMLPMVMMMAMMRGLLI
jgi:serine protease AprX